MRRARNHSRPADLPEPADTVSVSQDAISANGPTAITSGKMRARSVAVQGSPLRCDRALCARLARVIVTSWTAGIVGERETLTAPLSERVTLAIT